MNDEATAFSKDLLGKSFREPMQLGSLRLNSPPDCLAYSPSFLISKRISLSAESDLGRCPKNPQVFSKKT